MTVILHTNRGIIRIKLFTDEYHDACLNFLQLCKNGFYNGLIFHRIIPNYIIQTGDDSKSGVGGRCSIGESIDVLPSNNFNEGGIVAYAEKGSVRSQFFITLHPQPELNNAYCGFGKVIEGYNVVQSISRIPTLQDNYPINHVQITSAEIIESPFRLM
ncbi:Peptidyl-prolyl cis-trans isomerase cyp10 [Tritrichomonas musculus]|uniref:Peptidyl-prolyl cis-trans isomerase n=1 Tax=Tritrichomonas musculus TaxID=1915356 RepID=A0ABR2HXN5_9EUKA